MGNFAGLQLCETCEKTMTDAGVFGLVFKETIKYKEELNFGQAFEAVAQGGGMRLPQWAPDVVIRAQYPDEHSKMTAPYLYVESRFGRVPWKETMIELFAENWEVVE
ncbi:hypothetical protein MKY15_20640 [Sporosarcina sp. FSL K6-1540]|uniref:Thoeris anti-defense Tad2 family protein n=2 Tax=Sporosarcina sp. FSL K6-1540 TaxID=2921555 RepID=UPI00315AB211